MIEEFIMKIKTTSISQEVRELTFYILSVEDQNEGRVFFYCTVKVVNLVWYVTCNPNNAAPELSNNFNAI